MLLNVQLVTLVLDPTISITPPLISRLSAALVSIPDIIFVALLSVNSELMIFVLVPLIYTAPPCTAVLAEALESSIIMSLPSI